MKEDEDGNEADQDSSDDEDPLEMREEVKELPATDTESNHTQPTNVTLNSGTSSKYKPESACEEDLDREFFTI